MVSSAIQEGNYITTLDKNSGHQNSFHAQGLLFGYSDEIICTQADSYINVYDSNGNHMCNFHVGGGKGQTVIDKTINVREENYLVTYDERGTKLRDKYVG
jgi:hypothetical protein